MTSPDSHLWRILDLDRLLDTWTERDDPPTEVQVSVDLWMMSRMDDPYAEMLRDANFPNLWHCVVPATSQGGTAVACAYEID